MLGDLGKLCGSHSNFEQEANTCSVYIGDKFEDLVLDLYCDADHASSPDDKRSTNGAVPILTGSNTWFPLMALSQKQRSTATSTPEAEVVSLFKAMKSIFCPLGAKNIKIREFLSVFFLPIIRKDRKIIKS